MKVSYENFERVTNADTNIGINDKLFNSKIYKWIVQNPNQKEEYEITGKQYAPSIASEYAKFGIEMIGNQSNIKEDREYVLLLYSVDPQNVEKDIKNFCEMCLPEDVIPTWYAVANKKYKSVEELERDKKYINSVFPNCQQLLDYKNIRDERYNKEIMEEYKNSYRALGVNDFIEISDYLVVLDRLVTEINGGTGKEFKKVIHQLVNTFKEHPSAVFYYTGDNAQLYMIVAATLKYFFNIECITPDQSTSNMLSMYSELVYNSDTMLVEEQINYLRNFPTLSFRKNDYEFMVFITKKREGFLRLQCCPVDNISSTNVSDTEIDINDIKIAPLSNLFDLTNPDENVIKEEHQKLLDILMQFENSLDIRKEILNLTNTFFFEFNGTLNIGYLEHVMFKVDGIACPFSGISKYRKYSIDLEHINSLLPLTMLTDWKVVASQLTSIYKELGITQMINPPKHNHLAGLIYKYYCYNSHYNMSGLEWSDFMTIGLYWKESIVHRTQLNSKLQRYLPKKVLRTKHSYISAFGGYHPLLTGQVEIEPRSFRKEK